MRDKIGERPIEVTESNDKLILKFYPMTKKQKTQTKCFFVSPWIPKPAINWKKFAKVKNNHRYTYSFF